MLEVDYIFLSSFVSKMLERTLKDVSYQDREILQYEIIKKIIIKDISFFDCDKLAINFVFVLFHKMISYCE